MALFAKPKTGSCGESGLTSHREEDGALPEEGLEGLSLAVRPRALFRPKRTEDDESCCSTYGIGKKGL